jgi:hypothetical protein
MGLTEVWITGDRLTVLAYRLVDTVGTLKGETLLKVTPSIGTPKVVDHGLPPSWTQVAYGTDYVQSNHSTMVYGMQRLWAWFRIGCANVTV